MPRPVRPVRRLLQDPVDRVALLFTAWVLTRLAVVALSLARGVYPAQENAFDLTPFAAWGAAFAGDGGSVPLRDGPWEYPAGAAPLVAAPALLRGAPYAAGFVGQMVLFDLGLLLLLLWWGRRRGSQTGAWLWVAVVPLLGPVALGRFDVVPTLLAAGGLVAAAGAAPLTAGVLLATGAVVKLWPALLVPLVLVLHRGGVRVVLGGVAVGLAVLALVARFSRLDHLLSFLTYQQERGLEVESVLALPLMAQRLSGRQDVAVSFGFGSYQVDGPAAELLLRIGDVGLVGVVLLVAGLTWRVRRGTGDPGQAVVVLSVVLMTGVLLFDKVISAQYPVWIAGLVALSLCWPDSPLRSTVAPLCAALVLTQLVYPLAFQDLLAAELRPVLLLAGRDALLLLVFAQATWAAWALGRPQGDRSEDEVPVDEQDRQHAEAAR